MSRCTTARGSSSGLSLVGPAKVKSHKSILVLEGSPEVENNFIVVKIFGSMDLFLGLSTYYQC